MWTMSYAREGEMDLARTAIFFPRSFFRATLDGLRKPNL